MANADLINPYYNLAAIRNLDMFFGRVKLLREFYHHLVQRQSISLVGPGGIGKSSFLYCASQQEMQARFPVDLSHHIFVLLDMREYIYKTSEEFFHDVCKEIIQQSKKVKDLSLYSEGQGSGEFRNLLNQIKEQMFYPVLLMDAFDNTLLNTHFDSAFFAFLRSHATFGKISYVTASIASLSEISDRNTVDSPFANIFYPCKLGNLTEDEAFELISVLAQRAGMPFTNQEVAWVRKEAGLHPFFIQRVCYALFEEKQQSSDGNIDLQDVGEKAFESLLSYFMDTWRHLTNAERTSLQDEIQHQSHEQRALSVLSESVLFCRFVSSRSEMELSNKSISEQDVEEALNKMDDPIALGETNLRLLKAVTRRLNDDIPSSVVEKGKIIREVLNEALEKLQGSGVRSDLAPDWALYSILFYRYFRYHLKNEAISDRLGFTSHRQYYRIRNQAIKALLNALLEMDLKASS